VRGYGSSRERAPLTRSLFARDLSPLGRGKHRVRGGRCNFNFKRSYAKSQTENAARRRRRRCSPCLPAAAADVARAGLAAAFDVASYAMVSAADDAVLEIGMDHTGGLRRARTLGHGPARVSLGPTVKNVTRCSRP